MKDNLALKQEIPFGRPWIDDKDRQAVMQVLEGHILTHGPKCSEFEGKFEQFTQGGHAVTTSSCMASLHLCALHFGWGPEDEIIVPAQTHVATVHAVELTGATPVFVDCKLETGNIDPEKIQEKITSRTKAILLVHFAGIPAEMDTIMEIAKKNKFTVIEDCALAVGATYDGKHVGLWGDAGCFSFYPVKHMTTAEGGMLISKDKATADTIAQFRAFNVDRTHSERKTPGVYDVVGVGLNYRMSELQAALGCSQIEKIQQNLKIRKQNFDTLKSGLLAIPGLKVLDSDNAKSINSYYCLVVVLDDTKLAIQRNNILAQLKEHNVGCSVYYPQPVPRMQYYQEKYGYESSLYPSAEKISDHSIALPVGPHLIQKNMEQIVATLDHIIRNL